MTKKHEKESGKRTGRPPEPMSLHAARARKERALAELREIEVRLKKATVLDADEVLRDRQDAYRQVRAGMLAIPSRLRAKIPTLEPRTVQILDAEIRRALTALGTGEPIEDEAVAD